MKNKKRDIPPLPKNYFPFAELVFLALNPDAFEKIKRCSGIESAKEVVEEMKLGAFLKLSVPLWVIKLKSMPYCEIKERQDELPNIIGQYGDLILYPSNICKNTKDAFNALSEGIALLAMLAEGGVEIFGVRFDYPTPEHWK